MTRLHQRHATPILGLALILFGFAALVFEWSPRQARFQQLPESILASTTGTTPSWHDTETVDCDDVNVERENNPEQGEPPDPPFVASVDCEEAADGSPCIICPITVVTFHPKDGSEQTDSPGGLVGPIDSTDCGSGEPPYQMGKLGHCEEGQCKGPYEDYACVTELEFYQEQSGNPGG